MATSNDSSSGEIVLLNQFDRSGLQACMYCKARKRKCDKVVPTCGLCVLKKVVCDYSTSKSVSGGESAQLTRPKYSETGQSRSVAGLFLDTAFYSASQSMPPKVDIPLVQDIMDFIGDARSVADQWFVEMHPWLPLFSRKKFYEDISGQLSQLPVDTILLLANIKLISWFPSAGEDPKTPSYTAAKRSLFEAQMMGSLSLSILQAMILLSMYEIGHAIYPAAYLSIGNCARYGLALGIEGANLTDLAGGPLPPLEQEARRRAWWEILIMDRYMNIGCPSRPLSTRDPDPDDLLPTDDESWDRGVIETCQLFTTSSPADIRMGSFARLAQSTYLLSRVLVWKTEKSTDEVFKQEQRVQLDRTLHSLINLSFYEGQVRRMPICAQTAISYCALMILHTPKISEPQVRVQMQMSDFQDAMAILRPAAEVTSLKSRAFLAGATGTRPLLQTSPLLLHWAYLAASVYGRIIHVAGVDTDLGPLQILKTKLKFMSERWLAAGEYLRLLSAKEVAMGLGSVVSILP